MSVLKEWNLKIMIFTKRTTERNNIVQASFIVAEKIANHLKPFTEGDFLKDCIIEVSKILYPDKENIFERWTDFCYAHRFYG